jgi:cellobiose-specific phosphotransferase system component IIA
LDPDNADNHFRHGIACYRSGQYREAEDHLRTARGLWESQQKNAAAILFYEAMSEAQQNKMDLATQSLARARNAYAQTDLKYRETHAQELADLLWEAQRVVDGLASAN